jgi:hypothetical protein
MHRFDKACHPDPSMALPPSASGCGIRKLSIRPSETTLRLRRTIGRLDRPPADRSPTGALFNRQAEDIDLLSCRLSPLWCSLPPAARHPQAIRPSPRGAALNDTRQSRKRASTITTMTPIGTRRPSATAHLTPISPNRSCLRDARCPCQSTILAGLRNRSLDMFRSLANRTIFRTTTFSQRQTRDMGADRG